MNCNFSQQYHECLKRQKKWLIAVGLSMGWAMANGFARFAYALLLPSVRADVGCNYAQVGWLNTRNRVGYLIGSALSLFMVYRFGPKRLFIWGFTLTTMAMFGSAGTTEILAQSLFRMIAGVGAAPVFVMDGVLVAILFPREPKLNSFTAAVYFGGGGFGMFIVGLVFKNYLNNHFPNG